MTSINTNLAATSALRTLQATNTALDATQSRISTGLKIGEAKDNAAYWSISTTLKSDNKALSTVKDALNLGGGTVDVAYQALNATLDVLNDIKSKLTAATAENVDRTAIQSEIAELTKQLRSIAGAATFSGENWLNVNSGATGYSADKSIVSGFTRAADGSVSLGTIGVNIGSIALIDTKDATTHGILEGSTSVATAGALATLIGAATGTADKVIAFGTATQTFGRDDVINFDLTVAGVTKTVTIDQGLVNSKLNVTDGRIQSAAEFKTVLDAALVNAGITASTTAASPNVTITGATTLANAAATGKGGVLDINITSKTAAQITAMITTVNTATNSVTAAAAKLGAVAKRIDLQQTFVTNLMDSIDKGISNLVDADMNEESTKLQALQVKQQLGVQALSIANQSAQNVLSLFRS